MADADTITSAPGEGAHYRVAKAGGDVISSVTANGHVVIATVTSAGMQCIYPDRYVANASGVTAERFKTHGSVSTAINVSGERARTDCCVAVRSAVLARIIIQKCVPADGSVSGAIDVMLERLRANCRVAVRSAVPARVIIQERVAANSGVIVGVFVLKEGRRTSGSVPDAIDVAR